MKEKELTKSKQGKITQELPMFTISIVAELLNVHQRTLRIYDEMDILVPKRTPKNRRLYSLNDIEKGKFIQYLTRNLGINLAGVKIILHLFKERKVNSTEYIQLIQKIAKNLNITEEIQEENKEKLSKRGRKPAIAK